MDKRQAAILGAAMAAATLGAWVVFTTILSPAGREDAPARDGSFNFPASSEPSPQPEGPALPASPIAVQPSPYAPAVQTPQTERPGESGLGFIRKDASVRIGPDPMPAAAPPRPEAARRPAFPAAASPAPPPAPPEEISPDGLRQAMQRVVDFVHQRQPTWYREFLRYRDLKTAADDYNSTHDFSAFLRELAASKNFARMLSSRVGKQPMHDLVTGVLKDPAARKVLDAVLADPSGRELAHRYASKSGLPPGVLPGDAGDAGPERAPTAKLRLIRPLQTGKGVGSSGGQRLKGLGNDGFIDSSGGFQPRR